MSAVESRLGFETYDRIAIVAPHPDDDILGCGGLLCAAAESGIPIQVTYVTDGSRSHPRSSRFPAQRLRALRESEALAALACCGIAASTTTFLRLPDGRCESLSTVERSRLCELFTHAFDSWRPTLIFAPWRRDPHPDHRFVATLVAAVCAMRHGGAAAPPSRLIEYPVWLDERGLPADSPEPGEARRLTFAFGSRTQARKREALARHRSQTGDLIDDDPDAFRLSPSMLERACSSPERFYEVLDV